MITPCHCPKRREFKEIVLFGSEGTMAREMEMFPVMQELYQTAVVKIELNRKVKLWIYKSIYVLTLWS